MLSQPSSQPSRRSAIAIGAYFFVNGATYASWVPRLPQIKDALGVSDTQLGLTLVGGVVGSLVMSFAFAPAVTRFGSRRMTMVSSMVLTLLLPLIAFAPSALILFGALACLGTVDGFADVAVNTQGLQLQSQQSKSIINRLHGTWSIGALSGGLIASRSAAAGISVKAQLLFTSILLFTIALFAVRWLLPSQPSAPSLNDVGQSSSPEHTVFVSNPQPVSKTLASSGASEVTGAYETLNAVAEIVTVTPITAAARGHDSPSRLDQWREQNPLGASEESNGRRFTVTRRSALLFVVAGAAAVLAEIPATEWATLMIEERFNKSGGAAAIGFIGFAAGMVVGRFVGDAVTDRLGATRTRRLGGALNALGFIVACLAPQIALVIGALCFAGLGSSWLNPLLVRRASEVFDGPRGATLAGVGARTGILFGTPLMGRMSDLFGRSTALLLIGGGAAALMALLPLPGD